MYRYNLKNGKYQLYCKNNIIGTYDNIVYLGNDTQILYSNNMNILFTDDKIIGENLNVHTFLNTINDYELTVRDRSFEIIFKDKYYIFYKQNGRFCLYDKEFIKLADRRGYTLINVFNKSPIEICNEILTSLEEASQA